MAKWAKEILLLWVTGNTNENLYNVKEFEVSTIVFMLPLCSNQIIKNIFGSIISKIEEGWVIRPTLETTPAGIGVDCDYSPYLGWNWNIGEIMIITLNWDETCNSRELEKSTHTAYVGRRPSWSGGDWAPCCAHGGTTLGNNFLLHHMSNHIVR